MNLRFSFCITHCVRRLCSLWSCGVPNDHGAALVPVTANSGSQLSAAFGLNSVQMGYEVTVCVFVIEVVEVS